MTDKSAIHFEGNNPSASGPVRVLCSANATYAAPLCVMLVSLVANLAKDREIEIYALATRLPDEDRRKIEISLCRNRPDFKLASLHWLSPSLEVVQDLPVTDYIDIEAYSRLLSPWVLPEDFDKVLYLDCDTVVLSDVSSLYDAPCKEVAILAVRDEPNTVSGDIAGSSAVFNYSDLGIPPDAPYFNSGVMLINLNYWRERRVADRVIDYLKKHGEAVLCWDQGGLNAILHDSWIEVDPAWNAMKCSLCPEIWSRNKRSLTDWKRTLHQPKIIHYNGRKPWKDDSEPRSSYYFNWLDKTSYRSADKSAHLEQIIGFRLNYRLWRMKQGRLPIWIHHIKKVLRPMLRPPIVLMRGLLNKR